jgi:glucokinase
VEGIVTLVLAGDVGGTKTLLAIAEPAGESIRVVRETLYQSARYQGLSPIVREFLEDGGEKVAAACFGVPGPVLDGACRTPNLPWFLTEETLARETSLAAVRLVNDFAAAAMGVLALPSTAFLTLQEGNPEPHGTRAVIGAGTGLGQAVLFWDGHRYRPNATEGGHAGFSPQGELQRELGAFLEQSHSRVSVERAVSGPGLLRIYRFLVARGVSTWPEVAEAIGRDDPGEVIARHALAGTDLACEQALDLFVTVYGSEAGNMALRTMATGGMYVGGGIAPKILPKLREGSFLEAFRAKGRMTDLMSRIPLRVVLEPRAGLLGAALEAVLTAAGAQQS